MPVNATMSASTLIDNELYLKKLEQDCLRDLAANNTAAPPEPYCRGVWDGWSCWPDTPAGETVYQSCPTFVTGFDPMLVGHKQCMPDGTWFLHPESNQPWSNYTTCVNLVDLEWQQHLNRLYETGYSISLVALLLSLGILTYFRSLRCARITLHMNLFASFAMNNALWLIWYGSVVNTELLFNNSIMCRILHVILHYFLLTNYAWMLCEGFYLHTILVSAFTSDRRLVKWLMALGWSVPAVIIVIYTSLRSNSLDPADSKQCYIHEGNYMVVLMYPVCVSMAFNLLFLCNIVRVVVLKLRSGPSIGQSQPPRAILQAFKATFLLVPLLGLHYLVVPLRPEKGASWEKFYSVISAITASFQGLCVSVLFCFCNGEVIQQFKRKWEGTAFARKRANSCTATTVSVRWRERRKYDYQSAPLGPDLSDDQLVSSKRNANHNQEQQQQEKQQEQLRPQEQRGTDEEEPPHAIMPNGTTSNDHGEPAKDRRIFEHHLQLPAQLSH
uniref:Calcitonin receptor n=1 Tax=Trichogramma kaykai TaxID=54128 RepID=A0ABD2XA49_9HYME